MDTLFRWPINTFHKGYTRQMNNSWLKRNTRYDDSTPQRVYFHHRRSTLYNLCFLYPSEKTLSPEEQHTSGTTHFRRLTLVTRTTLVMSSSLVRKEAKNRQKNRIDMCSCNVTQIFVLSIEPFITENILGIVFLFIGI